MDETTGDGMGSAVSGGRLRFDDGPSISGLPAARADESDDPPDDGFVIYFAGVPGPCPNPRPIPTPDRVDVIVVRDGCEMTLTFEVTEENFVDPEAPEGVLELRNPILVPPCEEEQQ